jgi:hypothetical protein
MWRQSVEARLLKESLPTETLEVQHVERSGGVWTAHLQGLQLVHSTRGGGRFNDVLGGGTDATVLALQRRLW